MSRKSRLNTSVVPRTVAGAGRRRFRFWRGSPARSASGFSPLSIPSKATRTVQTHPADHELDLTLLDEMALIGATPLGVDDVIVPVGLEGLQQDWTRVGELLQNAMGVASIEEVEDPDADREKDQ